MRKALLALLILVVIVKLLFLSCTYHHPSWDEAVFLGMGKWIYSGGEIGLWETIRPPGLPLTLSIGNLFGNYILYADIIISAFVLGVVGLTYLITKHLFDYKTAIAAAVITYITPVFFYNSNQIMTGIPSLFFCLLALHLYLRKSYILSGIACSLAFLFRFPAGLMLPAISIIMLYELAFDKKITRVYKKTKKNINPLLKFHITFIILMLVYLFSNKIIYGSFFQPLILASGHQSTFAGNITGWAYVFFYPAVLFSSNLFLLFALFTPKIKKNLYPLIPFILFFLYFTIIPHKKERFLILLLPYISILAAAGIKQVLDLTRDKYFRMTVYFILFLLLIPSLTNTFLIYKNSLKQEPEFVDTYYNYIQTLEGLIITSDPVPAAYTDKKFIDFYDDTEMGLQILKNNIDDAGAVIYSPEAFPWNDTKAKRQKQEMKNIIEQKAVSKKNITKWGRTREIYVLE